MTRRPPEHLEGVRGEHLWRFSDGNAAWHLLRPSDFDRSFVRRSLRPVPQSPLRALADKIGDFFLAGVVLAVALAFMLKACS